MTSFAILTLGCKVNQEEGAAIIASMREAGFMQQPFNQQSDIYIINTCTVTHIADSKSRQMISRAAKQNPEALIVVTGCYAQTNKEAVADLPRVDIICGNEEKTRLVELIKAALQARSAERLIEVGDIMQSRSFVPMPAVSEQSRARAYLKIEDGCDQFCSYCIVPYARGPVRSLPYEQAFAEAQTLVQAGHKELVLSGIHVGAYGRDNGSDLCELLRGLLQIKVLERIRISSIEPLQISEELLALIAAEPRICRHLHIPLQSGCDRTLAAMGRKYDTAFYDELCDRLRRLFPTIAISTDIMCGFPDESDEDFARTAEFVRRIGFASAHIFPYSKRIGTPAAIMSKQVAENIKAARAKELTAITDASKAAFMQSFIGSEVEILPEKQSKQGSKCYLFGHTDNFLPVLCEYDGDFPQGLLKCKLCGIADNKLLAGRIEFAE